MARWLQLASQEPDAGKRADLSLVRVFAEAAGCQPVWDKALEGFNVIESKVVKEWQDQARAVGLREGRRASLLRLLPKQFGALPDDLRSTVEAVADPDQLDSWIEIAALVGSLDDFRRQAGA